MLNMKVAILFLCALIALSDGYRFLVVFPMCAKSHNILGDGVVNNLLEHGHEVVQITCYGNREKTANLTQIDLSHVEKAFAKSKGDEVDEMFKLKNLVGQKNFANSLMFYYITHTIHHWLLTDDVVTNFLSDTSQQFDGVIIEWFFSGMLSGVAPMFKSPLIWVGTTEAHWQVLRMIDDIPNPAYTADVFSEYSPPLDFFQSATELWGVVKRLVVFSLVLTPIEKYYYHKIYSPIAEKKGLELPSYDDAVYNGSMLLLNSHPSMGTPFRLPQNAHYIGGYHINRKVKPLPDDLQKVMDDSKHGVIYFSMGSNLQSSDMSDDMKSSLLKVFSQLKQTVIWKFESDLDDVPKNVKLVKWAPQPSILAHPNLKLFITHGGQLSTTEAIHFGVPVVGIPVFGDQHINMKAAANKGCGITVELKEDLADELAGAIRKMVDNPKYFNRAKELSAIFHDRPMTPGEELVYRVEHVVRTRGATHLRSPALHANFYQKLYLDLLLVLAVILYVLCRIVKGIKSLFGKKKTAKAKKS